MRPFAFPWIVLAALAASPAIAQQGPGTPDVDDTVYASTSNELYTYDPRNEKLDFVCKFPRDTTDITETRDGRLMAISGSVIYLVRLPGCEMSALKDVGGGGFFSRYTGLVSDRDGNVYVGGNGIIRWREGTWRVDQWVDGGRTAGDMVIVGDVMYWATAFNGLKRIELATGKVTDVGQVRKLDGEVWGLAQVRSTGMLLGFTDRGEIATINPSNAEVLHVVETRHGWNGAAAKPLTKDDDDRPIVGGE